MQMINSLFAVLAFAALVGWYKPYTKKLNRYQFAGFSLIFILIFGITIPKEAPQSEDKWVAERAQEIRNGVNVQTAAEYQRKEAEDRRRIMGYGVKQIIRNSARNPDSVVFDSIRGNDDASLICVEFRAENGFGGMNREILVIYKGKPSQSAVVWNKRCRVGLYDMK